MKNMKQYLFGFIYSLTIKRRLLITYLLLSSSILFITAITFYNMSRTVLVNHAITTSEQQLTIITNNLKEKIDHISDYAITLSLNSTISKVLQDNPMVPNQELTKFFVNSDLTQQVQRIIGLHRSIFGWDILDTENQWFHSSSDTTEALTPYITIDFIDSLKNNLKFQLIGPFSINEEPFFVGCKPIINMDNTHYLGTFILLIQESEISSAFRDLPYSNLSEFYVLDHNKKIISSSTSDGIYSSFCSYAGVSEKDFQILKDRGRTIVSIAGEEILLLMKEQQDLNWTVVNIIPTNTLTMDYVTITNNIIFISLLLFVLSMLFSIVFTKSITSPLQKLARKMATASEGNLSITANYHYQDEISILYTQFNRLMNKINILLDNIYEEQNAKQQMEFKLLQSQINPHFLYNTLGTIKSLIELGMSDTAVKAVISMSGFYRNSLSNGNFIIPLKQELELTQQYLYIQGLRFMECVDYSLQVDTKLPLESIIIPKLTLQPVVENIFVHALSEKKCHINISITNDDDYLYITIEDNGIGIIQEKLERIQTSINNNQIFRESFGIPSINHRIFIMYGEPYGLNIYSKEREYTKVIITLPKGETNEDNYNHR